MSEDLNFKLYPPQRLALTTAANEILYGGAAGGGKSYLARALSIVLALGVPNLQIYLFRRTYKEVLANHVYTPGGYLEMLKPLLDNGSVSYLKTENVFEFYNGARINLAHCQYEANVYDHQGAQIGFLIIDEATHFTKFMVSFLRSRVRLGSLVVPDRWKGFLPRILYVTNPGGIGHHYFKSNFVDFGPHVMHTAPRNDGGMTRIYIPSKLSDNKVLVETDPTYADRILGLSDERLAQAMLDGDWDLLASGGFADLWQAQHIVWKPFKIPQTWKIDRGYDYGSSAPAAALWFAESDGESFLDADGVTRWVPKGSIFIIKECYLANSQQEGLRLPADEQAKRIYNAQEEEDWSWRVRPGPADNAIFDAAPGKDSIADEMAKEHITFIRGDKTPGSRVQGYALMRNRLSAAAKQPYEKPIIGVFSTCHNTIRTLPNLENDKNNPEDIDTNGEDHIWDVIRYRLLKASIEVRKAGLSGA